MRYTLLTLITASLLWFTAGSVADTDEDVEFLLQYVADSGCTFVRNAERHNGAEASAHLRMKYDQDKRHIKSAEQFIDRLASASSLSGQPYVVTCGGKTQTSRDWLNEALVEYHLNK